MNASEREICSLKIQIEHKKICIQILLLAAIRQALYSYSEYILHFIAKKKIEYNTIILLLLTLNWQLLAE